MRLSPGMRLGPYEIVAPLGSGGMGEVYSARDSRLGRTVAVKVLSERFTGDPEAVERFHREARAVAALSHPNILAIHEFDIESEIPIVVTELLDGVTLRERLVESRALGWRKAVEIALAVADGAAAAHARGIIHRDLKPENIFLTNDGLVKVLDFGLAHFREAALPEPNAFSTTTPKVASHAFGTAGYGSPEQLTRRSVSPASDIFSLGVILYEMISGSHPFSRPTLPETIAAVIHVDPPPLGQQSGSMPGSLDQMVRRCLEKEPEDRFQSGRELAHRLRDLLSESREVGLLSRIRLVRGRTVAQSAAALLLAIVVAAVMLSMRTPVAPDNTISSLAILPLTNTSRDPALEYLTDGVTESLINELSELLPAVRVIARPTAFLYKDKALD